MSGSICCSGLTLQRDGRNILGPLDLEIPAGSKLAVVGPNGAGKSTLLKCLMRIHGDYGGQILMDGQNISHLSQTELAQRMAYVPQSLDHLPAYAVEEFVMLGRYPHLGPYTPIRPSDRALIAEIIEKLELAHLTGRNINTLSGGERQRVLIAAALAQEPKILLLDEPLTFLDPPHQVSGAQLLLNLHLESKITLVLVTHELTPVILHDYKILALDKGACFFHGGSEELMKGKVLDDLFKIPFHQLPYPESRVSIPSPWRPL